MTLADLKRSLARSAPPDGLAPAVQALWWSQKGEWDRAHEIVMEVAGPEAAWVHAYLHRVEGDITNATYWYRQADKPVAAGSLHAEWDTIAAALLATAEAE